MLPIALGQRSDRTKILCIGAHCDDIEIGCGGTIMRLGEQSEIAWDVKWVVVASTAQRSIEAKASADFFLRMFSNRDIVIRDFKDGFLPYNGVELKLFFEELKKFKPDIIFTHYRQDLHQDHRFLCELTWNTFRDHLIFEYEIPKYDGDIGNPNFFVPLDNTIAENKVNAIVNYFPSQSDKQWFDKETFFSMMRLRGIESASQKRYAEAFYLRKMVLS
jgi:LmbE family N-acetylglucosaminyl deacetylase